MTVERTARELDDTSSSYCCTRRMPQGRMPHKQNWRDIDKHRCLMWKPSINIHVASFHCAVIPALRSHCASCKTNSKISIIIACTKCFLRKGGQLQRSLFTCLSSPLHTFPPLPAGTCCPTDPPRSYIRADFTPCSYLQEPEKETQAESKRESERASLVCSDKRLVVHHHLA